MAGVADLTTAQQETLVAEDFAGLLRRLNNILAKTVASDDAEQTELDYIRGRILALDTIIRKSGDEAAIQADAILNP